MTAKHAPSPDNSTFASRTAAREARGEPAESPRRIRGSIPAGVDQPQPEITVVSRKR